MLHPVHTRDENEVSFCAIISSVKSSLIKSSLCYDVSFVFLKRTFKMQQDRALTIIVQNDLPSSFLSLMFCRDFLTFVWSKNLTLEQKGQI
mgnify:CR=1 FL=1